MATAGFPALALACIVQGWCYLRLKGRCECRSTHHGADRRRSVTGLLKLAERWLDKRRPSYEVREAIGLTTNVRSNS